MIKQKAKKAFDDYLHSLPVNLPEWIGHRLFLYVYPQYNECFFLEHKFRDYSPTSYFRSINFKNDNVILEHLRQVYRYIKVKETVEDFETIADVLNYCFEKYDGNIFKITPRYEHGVLRSIQIALNDDMGIGFIGGIREAMSVLGYINDYQYGRFDGKRVLKSNNPFVYCFQFVPVFHARENLKNALSQLDMSKLLIFNCEDLQPEDTSFSAEKHYVGDMELEELVFIPALCGNSIEDLEIDFTDIDLLISRMERRVCPFDDKNHKIREGKWESGKEYKYWRHLFDYNNPKKFINLTEGQYIVRKENINEKIRHQ